MPLAVYVHFPWCLQRCPYCDFATEAIAPRDIPQRSYADAVIAELAMRRDRFGGARLGTVFFGGGTPSLWEPTELGRVLEAVVRDFGSPGEVTVECNPTSLDRDRARALASVGVNRVSIGVQSLRDPHLRYLGRLHDAAGAVRAISDAADAGALRVSADLMFGMPDQSLDALCEDALRLVALGARHVSAYALTIEPATRFGELARKGRLPRMPENDVASLYEGLEHALAAAGMEHYEVSNYAFPGERAEHNLAYWRGEPYLGLGAGAVGCWHERAGEQTRYRDVPGPGAYIDACTHGTLPAEEREDLDGAAIVREGLMLGLRTDEGTALDRLARRAGCDPMAGRERSIARRIDRGDLVRHGDVLQIPRPRWLVADDIVASVF